MFVKRPKLKVLFWSSLRILLSRVTIHLHIFIHRCCGIQPGRTFDAVVGSIGIADCASFWILLFLFYKCITNTFSTKYASFNYFS